MLWWVLEFLILILLACSLGCFFLRFPLRLCLRISRYPQGIGVAALGGLLFRRIVRYTLWYSDGQNQ